MYKNKVPNEKPNNSNTDPKIEPKAKPANIIKGKPNPSKKNQTVQNIKNRKELKKICLSKYLKIFCLLFFIKSAFT